MHDPLENRVYPISAPSRGSLRIPCLIGSSDMSLGIRLGGLHGTSVACASAHVMTTQLHHKAVQCYAARRLSGKQLPAPDLPPCIYDACACHHRLTRVAWLSGIFYGSLSARRMHRLLQGVPMRVETLVRACMPGTPDCGCTAAAYRGRRTCARTRNQARLICCLFYCACTREVLC